jgi:hypothetical protein
MAALRSGDNEFGSMQYLPMGIQVTLDCSDLDATAAFWSAALRCSIDHLIDGRYVSLHGAGTC